MSNDLTTRPIGALDFAKGFTPEQVDLVKETICKGATNDELNLFLYQCQSRRLDPFAKQIYAVKRWDNKLGREVMTSQTGIDGFRVVAERTGKYRGQTIPEWCGEDGKWVQVWLSKHFPSAARIGVHREGFKEPVYGIALWREYVQTTRDGTPSKFWQNMGANQLAKCAESLALRKAFPEDLSGLYTNEEMNQADREEGENKTQAMQAQIDRAIVIPKETVIPPTPGTITPIVVKAHPLSPEKGDALGDYIVPEIVKSIAHKRLYEVPLPDLQKAIDTTQDYFNREHRPATGRWVEFFARADEWIAQNRSKTPPTADNWLETAQEMFTPREPGEDG